MCVEKVQLSASSVSHANNKTKKVWYPNLQKMRNTSTPKPVPPKGRKSVLGVLALRFCEESLLIESSPHFDKKNLSAHGRQSLLSHGLYRLCPETGCGAMTIFFKSANLIW